MEKKGDLVNEKEERKMAVSKATLRFISADVGDRLVKDIEQTIVRTTLIKDCKSIIEKLKKHKGK